MKAIILISSIFYFLGLFIGNKFHIVKQSTPIESIIVNKIKTIQPTKVFHFGENSDEKVKTTPKTSEVKPATSEESESSVHTTSPESK